MFKNAREFLTVAFGAVIILVIFFVEFGLFVLGAVAVWPSGFLDTPFAQMTIGMLLRVVGSVSIIVVGVVVQFGLWLIIDPGAYSKRIS